MKVNRMMMVTTVAMMASVCAAVVIALSPVECHTYRDAAIRMTFPEMVAGLSMKTRTGYSPDGDKYRLGYWSAEDAAKCNLSIYVNAEDGRPIPDGVNDAVLRRFDKADESIKKGNSYLRSSGMVSEGQLEKSRLKYLWNSYLLRSDNSVDVYLSLKIGFSLRNRIIELWYCELAPDGMETPCEVLPQRMLKILSELDELISSSEIDVYGIADPTNRLAAIRLKWPRAADRVSQWKMPYSENTYERIMQVKAWCKEKYSERIERYEENCREAISSKIDPALWYYNLSCALAKQKKDSVEVLDVLEQAVAAGYNCAEHAKSDSDFGQLTNDVRFLKLCESMIAINKPDKYWYDPQEPIVVESGKCYLSETNVCYAFDAHSYRCCLDSTNPCPIVYLNHHAYHFYFNHSTHHDAVPCEGLIVPQFQVEAVLARRNVGAANMHLIHLQKRWYTPTIVASDWTQEEDRMDSPMSIPAAFGTSSSADCEMYHFVRNVIGIYTAASDYAFDGVDRFIGHFPICIAHTGGADESDKFVCLCRDIISAMSPELRKYAAVWTLDIIRHAQKCVKSEDDYMGGKAWRPVLSFSDLDVEKAVSRARNLIADKDSLPLPPPIAESKFYMENAIPCTDLWDAPYDRPHISESRMNSSFIARDAQKTQRYEVKVEDGGKCSGEFVWKVLQGDESKVRFISLAEDKSRMRIEVDWHNVFDVELPDGRKVKSSRVDIGCFSVRKGRTSLPAIISVYFSPNETREYGADGKLVSIDYAKRQLEGFCPKLCPRGDWKDVFHWDGDGRLTGWTRFCAERKGRVTTNEFTREGLMVDTRDALGRPKDVHRSMVSKWKQKLDLPDFTNETGHAKIGYFASQYDRKEDEPLETTLAWKYEYENDADRFGKPSPKAPAPFRYRPELCLRADFAENSGFRLPLMDQMRFGFYIHAGYRHDTTDWFNRGDELIRRDDSRIALEAKGLKQPSVLKKMKFCPWKPGTNDVWKLDYSELDGYLRTWLMELADGVYRLKYPDGGGEQWSSVAGTYTCVNDMLEEGAYARLDKAFRRCSADEVQAVGFHRGAWSDFQWDKIEIAADGHLKRDDNPDGKITLAMWQIAESVYLGVQGNVGTFRDRDYYFVTFDKASGTATPLASFCQLPSRAIGNVVLAADAGDANALNNLAVLCYAGIANPDQYDESAVIKLLRRAAKLGCLVADGNLRVLHYNRGEAVNESAK